MPAGGSEGESPEPCRDARPGHIERHIAVRHHPRSRRDNLVTPSPPLALPCPPWRRSPSAQCSKVAEPALEIARKFLELLSLKRDEIERIFERFSSGDFIHGRIPLMVAGPIAPFACRSHRVRRRYVC